MRLEPLLHAHLAAGLWYESCIKTPMATSQLLLARLGRHALAHSYRVLVLGISETGDLLKSLSDLSMPVLLPAGCPDVY